MTRTALAVLAVVGAVALGAAGCGGDGSGSGSGGDALSKDAYTTAINDAGKALGQTFDDLAAEANALSAEDISTGQDFTDLTEGLAEAIGAGITAVETEADELDALTPPEDAQEANGQLAEGLNALAADMEEIQAALEGGDFAGFFDLATSLQNIESSDAGMLITGAIDDLKSKGYDLDESE